MQRHAIYHSSDTHFIVDMNPKKKLLSCYTKYTNKLVVIMQFQNYEKKNQMQFHFTIKISLQHNTFR